MSAATFFAALNGGAGFHSRLHERAARQDDTVSDVASLTRHRDTPQPHTVWPLLRALGTDAERLRTTVAPGNAFALARSRDIAGFGAVVLPPPRAPPTGELQQA